MMSKVWRSAKWWGETMRGAAVALVSPNQPIEQAKLHPRMPAMPSGITEFIRMNSWRYQWQYFPFLRIYLMVVSGVLITYHFILPIKPRVKLQQAQSGEHEREHHREKYFGSRQRMADRKYFEQYDPLRHHRQADIQLVYGGGGGH